MAIELATAQTAPTAIEPIAARRRRLTAVMLADVVGYSRMMSRSEAIHAGTQRKNGLLRFAMTIFAV